MNDKELIRVRVYLPKTLYSEVTKIQLEEDISFSRVVEQLLKEALGGRHHDKIMHQEESEL